MSQADRSIIVRDAYLNDSGAIAALLAELGYPADASQVSLRIGLFTSQGNGRVLVAVSGGKVAGFIAVEITFPIHREAPVAHISALAVSKSAKRHGIGRQLLRSAEEAAKEKGCRHMVVTSAEHRADAHAFYESQGWFYTGRRFGKALL
jgi:GNAT superfamily N-acetyltransferase